MAEDPQKAQGGEPAAGGTPQSFASFDEFLATQNDTVKALYTAETAGLRSALEKERGRANSAEKSYRDLAKTADPETAEKLRKLADEARAEADAAKAQLEFANAAVKLGCRNVERAYAISKALGLSAEQIKADPDFSGLFSDPKTPDPRPGAGTGGRRVPNESASMQISNRIRQAAGY